MSKRIIDILFSFAGIVILVPLYLIIIIAISIDSRGSVFFKQIRVGKNNKDFTLFKFRTMFTNSDKVGLLTIGARDKRITHVGYYLRKYKLDELPQLFNVILGDMSFVGPRPEVRKYVSLYSNEQLKVLDVKPGITDYASIKYINESELLAQSKEPENTYIHSIMPEKIKINLQYINNQSLYTDFKIIILTIQKIILK